MAFHGIMLYLEQAKHEVFEERSGAHLKFAADGKVNFLYVCKKI